jgi:hypothetical protein
MSLNKQLVHLNMTGGLQKKDDQFLVIPSKLTAADNVEFDDASTVITRGGQARLTLPAGYATAIRSFVRAGTANLEFEDGSTIRANGLSGASDYANWRGSALSYEPSTFPRVGVQTRRIAQYPIDGASFDVAYGATNYCLAWSEYDANLGYVVQVSIRSVTTDIEVQRNVISGAAASEYVMQPRVIYDSTNARFSIFTYHEDSAFVTASMKGSYVAETGGSFTGPTILIAMSYAGGGLSALADAAIYPGQGYCLVSRDADLTGTVRMRLVNLSHGSIVASTSAVPATVLSSLTAHATYSGGVLLGHAIFGAGANLRGYRLPSNTGVMSASVTIRTLTGTIGRVVVTDVSGALHITIDQLTATSDTYATTYLINATTAHVFTSQTAISTNCFIDGRSFSMRSRNFVPMVFTSNSNQSTHFLLDITEAAENLGVATTAKPSFVSRVDYGEVAASGYGINLGARVRGSHASMVTYAKYETDLRLAGATNATRIVLVAAKFAPTEQLGDAEINGLALLAGALPRVCDGAQIVEEGFHWGPEVQGAALTPVTTGSGIYSFPSVGSYSVAFTEGWMDAQGNWHESAVARTFSLTTTLGNLDINPTFIRPPSVKNDRQLIMYRTKLLGTDTSLYLAHAGDLSTGTVVEVTDADLPSGEQLYTAGNVLPNTPAPACRHVSVFQKRLVLAGCGDGSRIYWSKQTTPGYGVEFNSGDPTHQTQVPADKGRAVATKEMDDRLVILCENGVGIIGGQGPDPTGTSGQYSDFSSIITETGCSWDSPKSVIRGPEGVWFRSPFGLRLVSRSGSLARGQDNKQVGSEVDALVSGNVVAIAGDAKQQLRFYQSSGTVLVWDYQWLQWTRFTGFANVDACYADDRYYHLSNYSTTTPLLRYTNNTTPADVNDSGVATQAFSPYIETPWLSFAGIQGFQRVYRLMILGKNADGSVNPMTFGLSLQYDFNDTYTSFPTVNVTPSTNGLVRLQHHFVKQKCESMKIAIYFFPVTPGNAGRFRLTDLTLQVGVKGGYFKLPSSQRF